MPRFDRRSALLLLGLAFLLALPFLARAAGEPYLITLATRIVILALAAVSLDLILGYGGMVSFGHAAFFGLGAYTVAILAQHAQGAPILNWPFELSGTTNAFLAWPAAMLVAGVAAFLIGLVALRTSGVYFIMITLAFAQMLFYLFVSLKTYGGDDGLNLGARSHFFGLHGLRAATNFYYVAAAILIFTILLGRRLVESPFGMVLRGSRDNDRRMRAMGFPTYRYRLVCFAISGAVAGLAGALAANLSLFVSPADLAWTRSGEFLVMVILGGMGSLFGPVLGAFALFLLEEVLSGLTEHWMVILGPLLVLAVYLERAGLIGSLGGRRG
jgi:branched-chain amino acid transport system permease protein